MDFRFRSRLGVALKSGWFWLKMLLSAGFSGAVSSLSLAYLDPKDFNFGTPEGVLKIKTTAIGGAAIGILHFLMPSPVPRNVPTNGASKSQAAGS